MNDDLTGWMQREMPFTATLGAELLAATPQEVRARVAWDPARCTAGGLLHGGVLMGLADAAGGVCAFLNLPREAATTATIASNTSFLRGVREGHVTATSRPVHVGSRVIVVESVLHDDRDRLVAKVTQSQMAIVATPPAPTPAAAR